MKNLMMLSIWFIYCFGGFDHVYCMNDDNKNSSQHIRQRHVTFVKPKEILLECRGEEQAKMLAAAILEDDLYEVERILKTVEKEGTHKTALSCVNFKEAGDANLLTVAMLSEGRHSLRIFERILDCATATDDDEVLTKALTVRVSRRFKEELGITPLSLSLGYEETFSHYFPLILDAIRDKPDVIAQALNARMAGLPILSIAISVDNTEGAAALLDLIKGNPTLVQYVLGASNNARYGGGLGYTPLMVAIARRNATMIDSISKLAIKNYIHPSILFRIHRMKGIEKIYAENLFAKLYEQYQKKRLALKNRIERKRLYGESFRPMDGVHRKKVRKRARPRIESIKFFKFD